MRQLASWVEGLLTLMILKWVDGMYSAVWPPCLRKKWLFKKPLFLTMGVSALECSARSTEDTSPWKLQFYVVVGCLYKGLELGFALLHKGNTNPKSLGHISSPQKSLLSCPAGTHSKPSAHWERYVFHPQSGAPPFLRVLGFLCVCIFVFFFVCVCAVPADVRGQCQII